MSLRIIHGKFHYRFQIAGHEYTGNTGHPATRPNRPAAEAVQVRAREMVAQGCQPQRLHVEHKPFGDAMAAYLEWAKGEHREHPGTPQRLAVSATNLVAFFGRTPVAAITAGQIEDFKSRRRAAGIQDVTLRHDLHCLAPMLRYARLHHWIGDADPMDGVEIPSDKGAVRIHVLTPAEETLYFQTALSLGYSDLHDLGRLMIRQGCRPGELMAMERADIDVEASLMRVAGGKTASARRSLRLVPESRQIVAGRPLEDGKWLFPRRADPDQPIVSLQRAHDRVMRKLGYGEGWVIYDFRHTFATRFAEATGGDVVALATILGHSNLRTVMKYVHPSQKYSNAAMETMDRWVTATAEAAGEELVQ